MPIQSLLAMAILQAGTVEPAFVEQLRAAGARTMVDVPKAVRLIEEPQLPRDDIKSQGEVALKADPRMAGRSSIQDLGERGERGMRLLAFALEPGERLTVKLVLPDPEKIQLSLAPPVQPGPMFDEVVRVNRRPVHMRSRQLQVRNVTAEPFTVVLRAAGFLGYAYRLEITREK